MISKRIIVACIAFGCILVGGCSSGTITTTNNIGSNLCGNSNGNISNGGYMLDQTLNDCDYVSYMRLDKNFIASLDLSGQKSKPTYLAEDYAAYLNFYDGWIYYLNLNDTSIYRIKPDGNGRSLIYRGNCKSALIYNNYIYLTEYIDSNYTIYSVTTEGRQKKEICKSGSPTFNIEDIKIYYWKDNAIYITDINGSNNEKLASDVTDRFQIYNGKIYALNSDYQLLSYSDEKGKVIIKKTGGNFNIYKDYIYFIMPDKYLYDTDRTYFENIKPEVVPESGTIFRANLDGSNLVYGSMNSRRIESYININNDSVISVYPKTANTDFCPLSLFNAHRDLDLKS